MIHDVKNDSILQVSSQEPSTSSKYGLKGWGVLDTLLFMLESRNLTHKSRITYDDDPLRQKLPQVPILQESHVMTIHDVKNDPILQVSSQEPSTSSKYGLQGRGVLDTLLIKLES